MAFLIELLDEILAIINESKVLEDQGQEAKGEAQEAVICNALIAFWEFYQNIELRFRQLEGMGHRKIKAAKFEEKPASSNKTFEEKSASSNKTVSFEEKIVLSLMKKMRTWFCEGRRGVLVDCLFLLLKNSKDEALAAISQEYIWTSWNSNESEEVLSEMEAAANYLSRGNFSNALGHLKKAIDLDPMHAEARNRLSTVLFMMNDFKESEKEAIKVTELEPRHFGALNGLAMIRMKEGDYSTALKYLKQVASINPW
eukprot:CAMPEP_0171473622 /NCGR_PEP_ID=MMETSP0946-20130122/1949_1 /TAXON_ID=109269 /ORGANISM="Vaucheria litorea, Strain CCMP2940" /LENGTH=255 /DNA_ID=CAMNT_0012003417 /DNA_START=359 /DNA_END=1123 /DNA_ORIENTATION=+